MIQKLLLFLIMLLPLFGSAQLSDKDKEILRAELADRINDLRESKGLKRLIFSDTLREAAEFHSDYMAKYDKLGHDEKKSKYATPTKRVKAFKGKDFVTVGENVLYTKPQKFPLNKKQLTELADEMFTAWKNSPGHYANMIEPEYVYGDLGFKTNMKKQIVFATQVFGTRGYVVEGQLSKNDFGLMRAPADCDREYNNLSNIALNIGNAVRIEGSEVVLYFHDIEFFKRIVTNPKDGIAIDFVSRDQVACGKPNQLDLSPIYDGILLKPIYSRELFADNRAESDYRIITKVADVPESMQGVDYSASVILIRNGKACKYIYPAFVPGKSYDLRPITPNIKDEPAISYLNEGIVHSQRLNYDFKTNKVNAIKPPKIEKYDSRIYSIDINSFSSVEGDSVHNAYLHTSRADFIRKDLRSRLNAQDDLFKINAKENWELMNFQLNYFQQDSIALLSRDSLKSLLANRKNDTSLGDILPWDSLLFLQRESSATINYGGAYNELDSEETFEAFNFRTAVVFDKPGLANKAMYGMYNAHNYDPSILFESQVIAFIQRHPETVTNYAALLSHHYSVDPYSVTRFIHHWLDRANELDADARENLLHLYTLVGLHLLDNWDTSAERLSNVIHPLKVGRLMPKEVSEELTLNLNLTYIQYYGQINDGPHISEAFNFIADYFKARNLKPEDDVDLALFFNSWSMYDMTVDYLSAKFKKDQLNEDGLFVLAQTMNYTNYSDVSGTYIEVHKKTLASNPKRWCRWLNDDFQVKRNFEIKRIYCESCE